MPRPSSSSWSQSPFQLNKKAHCHIRGKAPAIFKMGKIIATMKKNWACEFFSAGSSWSSSTSSSSLSSLSTGWSILKDSTPSFLHWPKKTRIFAIRAKKIGRNMRQRSSAKIFSSFCETPTRFEMCLRMFVSHWGEENCLEALQQDCKITPLMDKQGQESKLVCSLCSCTAGKDSINKFTIVGLTRGCARYVIVLLYYRQ